MTVNDILETVTFDYADTSTDYKAKARVWYNLVRSEIWNDTWWKCGLFSATITTTADTRTKTLNPYAQNTNEVDFILDIFDQTNDKWLNYKQIETLDAYDPSEEITGNPFCWSFDSYDSSDRMIIALHNIPSGVFTLKYRYYARLTEVTSSHDDSADPNFIPFLSWSPVLTAGLRYYAELNNNEDNSSIMRAKTEFERQLLRAKRKLNAVAVWNNQALRDQAGISPMAAPRFDPAHFDNSSLW